VKIHEDPDVRDWAMKSEQTLRAEAQKMGILSFGDKWELAKRIVEAKRLRFAEKYTQLIRVDPA